MTRASPTAFEALRAARVFSDVPPSALKTLAGLAREERYAGRTLVAPAGTVPKHLRWVQAGSVEISLVGADGRTSTLPPIPAGGWATWLSCFHDAPMPHDYWAAGGSVCLAFPRRAVLALAEQFPCVYRAAIQEIGDRTRAFMSHALDANALDVRHALIRFILATCRARACEGDGPVHIDMTREQIGRMGFGSRQRASRLLHALESEGAIEVRYGRVTVPSLKRLEGHLKDR